MPEEEAEKAPKGLGPDPDPYLSPEDEELTVYQIRDRYGEEQRRPLAIADNPFYKNCVTIDLIALVKQSAANIAHPAVIKAIQQWEDYILHRHILREGKELYKLSKF